MSAIAEKTLEELGLEIVEGLEKHFHVDLKRFINEGGDQESSFFEFRRAFLGAVMSYNDFEAADLQPDTTLVDYYRRAIDEPKVTLEPNIWISRHNANIIADYKANKVFDYVSKLSKNLEALSKSDSAASFAAQTIGGGLIAVGVPVAIAVAKNLLLKEALKAAITHAVTKVGIKAAVLAVAVALAGFLYWMIWQREAKILGLVINDTDTDFVVKDWRKSVDGYHGGQLFMKHGTTENFMSDTETGDEDSPEVQLKSRFVDTNDQDTTVAMGVYFADRKSGFLGAEGLYVFTPLSGPGGFAYQFAIPYSKKNGANIQLLHGQKFGNEVELDKLFRSMYDERGVDVDITDGDYRLRSHVQSPSGGVICGIASISTPIVPARAS